jgi:hypothetical protein
MHWLAQDKTEVAELQEEVTWPRVAAIMIGAHTAQTERMVHERAILLATVVGK